MKNFKIKDLMVTIYAGEQHQLHLMADGATCEAPSKCGQTKPDCMSVSKCSQTKPDCMAVSNCGQTKPDCMAVSNCGQTKPGKRYDDDYAAQLWTLKQTIAGMQTK